VFFTKHQCFLQPSKSIGVKYEFYIFIGLNKHNYRSRVPPPLVSIWTNITKSEIGGIKMSHKKYLTQNGNKDIPISKDIARSLSKINRRNRYIKKLEAKYGVFSYNAVDKENINGENLLVDDSENIADVVVTKVLAEIVAEHIKNLSEEQRWLIDELYVKEKSERQISKETGIPLMTICNRNKKILQNFKKLLKI